MACSYDSAGGKTEAIRAGLRFGSHFSVFVRRASVVLSLVFISGAYWYWCLCFELGVLPPSFLCPFGLAIKWNFSVKKKKLKFQKLNKQFNKLENIYSVFTNYFPIYRSIIINKSIKISHISYDQNFRNHLPY